MEFDTVLKLIKGYKTMKPDFWCLFSNFNYGLKCPDWSAAGCHGNYMKNLASWFCAHCSYVPPCQFWMHCENSFLSYICSCVCPIRGTDSLVTMATRLKRQPFLEVRFMGIVQVYQPCGWYLRKCPNLMSKLGLLTTVPLLK